MVCASREGFAPLKLLIVAGSEALALGITHQLESGGYQVSFRRVDGKAAMELALETDQWNLVICEVPAALLGAKEALGLLKS